MYELIRANRKVFMFEGIVMIILGILAMALPVVATFGIELLIGWLLIFAGIAQLIRNISMGKSEGMWASIFWSIVALVIGILFIVNPMRGVLTLTLLLTIFFILSGLSKIIWGIQFRSIPGTAWIIFSGVISLIMAGIIISGWPQTALWVIGLLFGIDLLFLGISLVSIAVAARNNN